MKSKIKCSGGVVTRVYKTAGIIPVSIVAFRVADPGDKSRPGALV